MPQKKLLEWFSNLSKESVALAGGKGASLGEMTRAGIPVPNGYVILSDSFEKFLEETDLNVELDSILDKVNHKEMQSIENASEEIKALIMNAKMPKDIEKEIKKSFRELDAKFVAVRSSATSEDSSSAAWAGQLDSFLNTKEDKLLENVKRCWASLFTPRAIFYRFEKGLHTTKISVAVVVQKMVNSEISGIAFSVHPVTQDRNQLIIEAGFGLGEAIVSGQITPDSYVVEKEPRRIIDKNVSDQERGLFKVESGGSEWESTKEKGAQQKLSDKQIIELSEIILRIEKHYGFPCDIEWAYEKGKFFIVQSRPITTLTDKSQDKEMPVASVGDSKKKDLEWAKDFLKKTPLDIKEAKCALIVGDFLFKEYAARNVFGEAYSPMFIPYSKTKLAQIIPMERIEGLERRNWDIFFNDKKRFTKAISDANKVQSKIMRMVLSYSAVSKLSDEKLAKYISELEGLIREWWIYGSIGEDKGIVVEEKIVPLLMKNHKLDLESARDYAMTVTMPKEQSIFSKERTAFLELCIIATKDAKLISVLKDGSVLKNRSFAGFVKKMRKYSKNFFYSRTDFYYAKVLDDNNLSKMILEHCTKTHVFKIEEELKHIKDNYSLLLKNKKLFAKKIKLTKEEQKYIDYFTCLQEWLDVRKLSMLKHIHYFFNAVAEVGKRKGFSYDEMLLFYVDEVKDLLKGKKFDVEEIRKRDEGTVLVFKDEKLLRAFYGEEAQQLRDAIYGVRDKSSLVGTVASRGKEGETKITGRVKIIFDPANEVLPQGDVLVTSMTRPEFVPIMKKAKAIITDEGGIACHAAIVSRELGIPCIIGTKNATKLLKSGDLVEINLLDGSVKKL